jgi:hypothetical protein
MRARLIGTASALALVLTVGLGGSAFAGAKPASNTSGAQHFEV